ncbi:MAG: 1,4-alpha-glucan branching protein GlgB [Vampirovibrionales bacterium]
MALLTSWFSGVSSSPSLRVPQPRASHFRASAPLITQNDRYLFNEGTHERLYECLGAHLTEQSGIQGTHFAVWAPSAQAVSVMSDLNGWSKTLDPLTPSESGIWSGFIPHIKAGDCYKFAIHSPTGEWLEKADPMAFHAELRPKTASRVYDHSQYQWRDADWMATRGERHRPESPISIYEVHLASWRRKNGHEWLTYRELAHELADYVKTMGFTHVELMPVMEHPFDGSWGYQITGYFAPTSRFGTPDDFKLLIDTLHQNGIGVLLDWVPAHFPCDAHGLGRFDGTALYEHADPREGFHPDWNTYIFNYGRHEVASFLMSNALFWMEVFHIDGLRVDAVASMLYRDYSRENGEWVPNKDGGRENWEAIGFLKRLNERIYANYPDIWMVAEESTAWGGVSRPTHSGGLGFGAKWDMGWMHDTLEYFHEDPIHRQYHHNTLTFRMVYAFTENYVLPLSHDEVVHGKGALLATMPGDDWQQFANLRLLYSSMMAMPGKKLLFMGNELAPWDEWNAHQSLPWHLGHYDRHRGIQQLVADCNRFYTTQPALHQTDWQANGFTWLELNDAANSIIAYIRWDASHQNPAVVVANHTPVVRHHYRVGLPTTPSSLWHEPFNSDAPAYGGSGVSNPGQLNAEDIAWQGQPHSVSITLPPLGLIVLQPHHRLK